MTRNGLNWVIDYLPTYLADEILCGKGLHGDGDRDRDPSCARVRGCSMFVESVVS